MILNSGAAGGGGLKVVASGERTIADNQDINITFEKPAAVAFVVELRRNETPCSICFPTGATTTSNTYTKFSLSTDGETLSVSPDKNAPSRSFDIQYLAIG